jgi:hypothetical protein
VRSYETPADCWRDDPGALSVCLPPEGIGDHTAADASKPLGRLDSSNAGIPSMTPLDALEPPQADVHGGRRLSSPEARRCRRIGFGGRAPLAILWCSSLESWYVFNDRSAVCELSAGFCGVNDATQSQYVLLLCESDSPNAKLCCPGSITPVHKKTNTGLVESRHRTKEHGATGPASTKSVAYS